MQYIQLAAPLSLLLSYLAHCRNCGVHSIEKCGRDKNDVDMSWRTSSRFWGLFAPQLSGQITAGWNPSEVPHVQRIAKRFRIVRPASAWSQCLCTDRPEGSRWHQMSASCMHACYNRTNRCTWTDCTWKQIVVAAVDCAMLNLSSKWQRRMEENSGI